MHKISLLLKQITSSWFYSEPLLFSVLCTHSLVENPAMNVPMRSGQRRIEYSPKLLEKASDKTVENYLRVEMYRILLGHPYARKPYKAQPGILLAASDAVVYGLFSEADSLHLSGIEYLKNQAVRFHTLVNPLGEHWAGSQEEKFFQRNLGLDHKTNRLVFTDDLSFEEWYKRILFLVKETSVSGENAGFSGAAENSAFTDEVAELWEENEEIQNEIHENIQKVDLDQGWGGLGGNLKRELQDSCDFSFDYRRALTKFRQNIVSANRKLTRMRPSRRYGFKAMGSRYERKANILIAVDVSGSITDESFEHFTHAIKNFFFLGIIEKIDLIFFDVNLKDTNPVSFSKKITLDSIKGRGGTNFQPALDYFTDHGQEYSGLIIFTDGEGEIPVLKAGTSSIRWILDSRMAYEKSRYWIESLPGNKATYLPF